jgi:hypothetical protein
MKRVYFYIIGGLILTILLGFWVYSFLYGSPTNNSGLFTNLGIFGQDNSVPVETTPLPETEVPIVDTMSEPLRQLTTKPVVGMRLLESETGPVMRYVEAGTGHIFDIDFATGQETRISQVSVPIASEAVISPSGDYVAIRSGYSNQNSVVLIDVTDKNNVVRTPLPNKIESFAFGYNNELLFTEFTLGQTEGKGYLPSTKATRRLFIAPFTAHSMAWSNSSTSNHIIFTKAAATQIGYAYEITAGGLKRLPQSGYGLSVSQSNGTRFIGYQDNGLYTALINTNTEGIITPAAVVIPEKCVSGMNRERIAFCAGPVDLRDPNFPDNWYKGELTFADNIWRINKESVTILNQPLKSVGRSLDVQKIMLSPDEKMVYFINKADKSLWLYEI